ncbi:hypothetical protein AMTR_s00051p00129540 [Amborella trichopoda]|uniref:Uncharacterized protein n=1 Tax=Amborella trichopoda TaxID=13333 RepID=U5D5F5_AMBTC|nr:hypothetical protein AMTR_s00051p00129540 [Amborella trichopoda]
MVAGERVRLAITKKTGRKDGGSDRKWRRRLSETAERKWQRWLTEKDGDGGCSGDGSRPDHSGDEG